VELNSRILPEFYEPIDMIYTTEKNFSIKPFEVKSGVKCRQSALAPDPEMLDETLG
jgi:hypothetical protein